MHYEENYQRGKKEAEAEIEVGKERGLDCREAFALCNPAETMSSKEMFEQMLDEEMSSARRDTMERNICYFEGYLSCFD